MLLLLARALKNFINMLASGPFKGRKKSVEDGRKNLHKISGGSHAHIPGNTKHSLCIAS